MVNTIFLKERNWERGMNENGDFYSERDVFKRFRLCLHQEYTYFYVEMWSKCAEYISYALNPFILHSYLFYICHTETCSYFRETLGRISLTTTNCPLPSIILHYKLHNSEVFFIILVRKISLCPQVVIFLKESADVYKVLSVRVDPTGQPRSVNLSTDIYHYLFIMFTYKD